MNLKVLVDYLNALDLDEIQPDVEVVYVTEDGCHCEDLAGFTLCFPEHNKPYLSLHCESFLKDMDRLEEKKDEV